ncbi:hypothetical protein Vretimale_1684 [Volvox reticuliferus]|uniref:FAD-binding FR-type domain-containing protein n=1 Tax=Volvox reticuliferus TaxID=1737510 RepID=A0A8J4CV25_9CHLO|nr:hypothetical protein Vretifemale_15518 [Volvox reticuliferus]GIL95718.1 hypothetical protein Vretimale_1684 [Volvox reticuliferus]
MNRSALVRHDQRGTSSTHKRILQLGHAAGGRLVHWPRSGAILSRRCKVNATTSRGIGRGGPQDDMDYHETKLGPNVIASIKDLRAGGVKWGAATVVRNDSQSLDNSVRVLHLAVADHVDMLYGRRVKGVPDATRWIESYTIPGQCVGLRLLGGPQSASSAPSRLFSIASSPYASRRDSAYVDASLIEVVVERTAGPEEAALADLGPGAQVEVTQVIGRGFSPLLDSYNGLTHALEEGRNLVLIAMGTKGVAAIRSALNWQPVLAYASSHSLTALYLTHSPGKAAFVPEWDSWREAGMRLRPLYTNPSAGIDDDAIVSGNGSSSGGEGSPASPAVVLDHERCMELLQLALFAQEGGFEAVCGGPSSRCSFLLAGLPGDLASALAKQLSAKGVQYEHILFAQSDFF